MEHILEAAKTFNFTIAFVVLAAYAVIDGLYAKYTLDVTDYNEVKAATVGAGMHFFIAFGVINYTQNWLYVIPLAIGSWIGTYFTVKKARLNKTKK